MKRRPRIYYSDGQKALVWERWKKGESLQQLTVANGSFRESQFFDAAEV